MATAATSLPTISGPQAPPDGFRRSESIEFHIWLPRARQCVFNAWTIPEYLELWSSAEYDLNARAEIDLHRGSSLLVAQKSGSTLYRIEGNYIAIDRPNRIVLTWSFHSAEWNWDSLIQVDFAEVNGGTMMGLVQSIIGCVDSREWHVLWWQDRLDRLMRLLS